MFDSIFKDSKVITVDPEDRVVDALGDVKDHDTGRTIARPLTEDGLRLGDTAEVDVVPDALGSLATEVVGRAVDEAVTGATPAYGPWAASQFDS